MDSRALSETLAPAGAGFWSWNRATGGVTWDQGVERLFGLEPGTFEGTFEGWIRRIHPDDLSPVLARLEGAIETQSPVLFDHRCIWPDGSVHWLECRGGLTFAEKGEVTGAVGISLDIDYRRVSEEERRTLLESERAARRSLESAWERLAQLHEVAVRLAAAAGVREVGQVIVGQGSAVLRADGGFFSTVDSDSDLLLLQAGQGTRPDVVDFYQTIHLDEETPAASVVRSGRPIFVTSHEDRQERFPELPDQGAAAFVIYPISIDGEVQAVLAYGFQGAHQFTHEEEELIDTIVGMSNQAIQRARLHDATRAAAERSAQLESVIARLAGAITRQEVADIVVDSLIPAVGAEKGSLYIVDEESRSLRALAIHGYPEETAERALVLPLDAPNGPSDAVHSREPVRVGGPADFAERYPDLARSFGTSEIADEAFIFPLIVEGNAIGTIGLGFKGENSLGEEERRHLSIVTGICAQALGRANAFEEIQTVGARLRSIDQITDAALSRLSLDDLVDELPARIASAIGCDAVRLLLIDEDEEFLEVRGHYGIPDERLARVPVGRGLSGTIAERGEPRVIEDISQHEVIGPPFPDHVTSEAGVPLRSGDRVIGVLDVGSGPQRPLTQADIELLEIAADRVATAIERSRVYELERTQRARSDLVSRVGEIINQVGPLGAQLEQMADLLCEGLAECCVLTVVSEFGRPLNACGHREAARKDLARAATAAFVQSSDEVDIPGGRGRERSRIYTSVQTTAPEDLEDPQIRHLVEALDLGSVLTVSLPGVTRPIGRAILGRGRKEAEFGSEDAAMMEDVAARIGAAIDGRMTFERHRTTAVTLQQSLLPSELPRIDGLDISARYWPASESFEVGGDFYDVIDMGTDRWGIMVGDVSGKGVEAAAMTGIARYTARAAARHGVDPSGVLRWVHEAFLEQAESGETYCTAVFGVLERQEDGFRFRFAVGGHPLPILRTHASTRYIGETGTVLGLIEPVELTESELQLGPGDWIVIYTDGVTDVPVTDAITEPELIEIVRRATGRSAREAMGSLDVVLASRYGHYRNRDDTAVLAIRCKEPDEGDQRDNRTGPGAEN